VKPDDHNALFSHWLDAHGAILHHVANGFATGDDRNDLLQELLLAVWRSIPQFRANALVSTFIYRVAHNTALTWKRTQRNYRSRIQRFESLQLPLETPEARSHRGSEALEQIYAHIRQLPPVDRSLILLHLDGVSYADIAQIHGLTESNVGVRLNRLKQKLSEGLKEISHELR